jgi:hypothetical protein
MEGPDGRCPNEFVAANYNPKGMESADIRIASHAAFPATAFPDPLCARV